jgi:hypothetical protein
MIRVIGVAALLAAATAGAAQAATIHVTVSGTVRSSDGNTLFGLPGQSLADLPYTATYSFDDTKGELSTPSFDLATP